MSIPTITRAAHAELTVTDLSRAERFYVGLLGMVLVERSSDALYLGCYEERDRYSLILRKGAGAALGHLAFRVADDSGLDALERIARDDGLSCRWIAPGSLEPGQGRALRLQDPSGLPLEFFHSMEQRPWLRQCFDRFCGAHIMRIDHFNCQVPDVGRAADWWTKRLGFLISEYTVTDDAREALWAAWLRRKQNVHDIALMNGIGPRLHHIGFWCQDVASVIRACDLLAAAGMGSCIERGPGRHGLSNAFFLYLRDPDGNRIELYTSDYLIADADFEPVKWKLSDPRRATFWGHLPPESWFNEAAPVTDVITGALLPTRAPLETGKPDFLT